MCIRDGPYDVFQSNYQENIQLINDSLNRHLLPLAMASATSGEGDGRLLYQIFGDVLSLTVRTDPSGEIIEMCQIMLTAPQGMEIGNAVYNDFANSGYHSYALLMAMDTAATAVERYGLVTAVEEGLKAGEGSYTAQIGNYALTCSSVQGTVTMTFENTLLPAAEEEGQEQDAPEEGTPEEEGEPLPMESTDEGAGLG